MNEYNPKPPRDWYEHWHALYLLVRYLVEERGFDELEILAVLEKPWKWHDDYLVAAEMY